MFIKDFIHWTVFNKNPVHSNRFNKNLVSSKSVQHKSGSLKSVQQKFFHWKSCSERCPLTKTWTCGWAGAAAFLRACLPFLVLPSCFYWSLSFYIFIFFLSCLRLWYGLESFVRLVTISKKTSSVLLTRIRVPYPQKHRNVLVNPEFRMSLESGPSLDHVNHVLVVPIGVQHTTAILLRQQRRI